MPNFPMQVALGLAKEALSQDEVPVGAVILKQGKIVAQAYNLCEMRKDPLAHAEFLAITSALKTLQVPFLNECDLYVTLEPCAFCAAAIALARLNSVFFGAYDPKGGAIDHNARIFEHSLHKPQVVGGIDEAASQALLKHFFSTKR